MVGAGLGEEQKTHHCSPSRGLREAVTLLSLSGMGCDMPCPKGLP